MPDSDVLWETRCRRGETVAGLTVAGVLEILGKYVRGQRYHRRDQGDQAIHAER